MHDVRTIIDDADGHSGSDDKIIFAMITEKQIEEALEKIFKELCFKEEPRGLYDPLKYMMSIEGKRVRPRLCLLAYSIFKDQMSDEILAPAAALEVFHSFTLIHDDIMDKADVRRGVPTVYRKWDENTAILSGDVMSIESYKLIAKAPVASLPAVLNLFSTTAAQVCEGQQYDMDFEDLEQVPMEDYMMMIGLKTAVLIACAAKMGAIVAGAGEKECDLLYKYGYDLGLAFQIADDWLDTFGNPKVFGKAIGGDILNNKKSWLLTHALSKGAMDSAPEGCTRTDLLEAMDMPIGTEAENQAKIARVKGIYEALGVGEDAKAEIVRLHGQALSYVSQLGLSNEHQSMLQDYANSLIGRTK
ncbi:MAG: polyprenyl synthetase family protein [Bacteroidales bacterium]|nr:polyprenyl synthetase family protein [Bacteroidales bacterium]